MRAMFSKALVAAARNDERIRLLTGDHGYALFDDFHACCPGQFINVGVAEQNMVGVAAGLAKAGLRPVVYGLTAFMPIRTLEQIKLDVCYEKLPVVFISDGAGVVYSSLGASHQSTEDIAALRAIPGMTILSPADRFEMSSCLDAAFAAKTPVYLRIGKADLGDVHQSAPTLNPGQLYPLTRRLGALAWIATGSMVKTAVKASQHWSGSSVWSAPYLKPLDIVQITDICREHSAVVVLEEHSIHGGLASAIAEISAANAPSWICSIGIQDRFSEKCGSYDYLMKEHQLDYPAVQRQVDHYLAQRSIPVEVAIK